MRPELWSPFAGQCHHVSVFWFDTALATNPTPPRHREDKSRDNPTSCRQHAPVLSLLLSHSTSASKQRCWLRDSSIDLVLSSMPRSQDTPHLSTRTYRAVAVAPYPPAFARSQATIPVTASPTTTSSPQHSGNSANSLRLREAQQKDELIIPCISLTHSSTTHLLLSRLHPQAKRDTAHSSNSLMDGGEIKLPRKRLTQERARFATLSGTMYNQASPPSRLYE